MPDIKPLNPEQLFRRCDPQQFAFDNTNDLEDLTEIVSQARAVDSVRFGIGIQRQGYNPFALGPSGIGKYSLIRRFLEQQASSEPVPPESQPASVTVQESLRKEVSIAGLRTS